MFSSVKSAYVICKQNAWKIWSSEFLSLVYIFGKYGPILKQSNEHPTFVKDSFNICDEIRKEIGNYKTQKNLRNPHITVVILENTETNAFAVKLSNREENYLIAIHIGLINRFAKISEDPLFINSIKQSLPQLSKLPDYALSWAAFRYCISFIGFHECAHVIRGHLNFCAAHGGSKLISETDNLDFMIDGKTLASHVIECDADNFAGRLLTSAAANFKKTADLQGWLQGVTANNHGFAQLACACASLVMLLFDREPNGEDYSYPIAPIRLTVALGAFADQLANQMPTTIAFSTAKLGMFAAVAAASALNWDYQKVDLNAKFTEWKTDFLPMVKQASQEFKDYYPEKVT